jgi:hypothetical protein
MDLRQDAGDKAFLLCNGEKARSVEELREKLLNISEQDYAAHANSQKNDFSAWVKDVYGDRKLAGRIAQAKTPAIAAAEIKIRLSETLPKTTTAIVKAPTSNHAIVHKVVKPEVKKIKIALQKPKILKLHKPAAKAGLKRSNGLKKDSLFSRLMKKKSIRTRTMVPDAHKFLTAYISMQRPTVSHLYFSKGISDFMLGLTVGIVIGIIIAHIVI